MKSILLILICSFFVIGCSDSMTATIGQKDTLNKAEKAEAETAAEEAQPVTEEEATTEEAPAEEEVTVTEEIPTEQDAGAEETIEEVFPANYRGNPWDFDAGAPKNSQWPDLFAETPNYRDYGKTVIGGREKKFRWKMGPMWYRGRLKPNSVKVFVIGQEGAQDENVSNRSFTGSTGTRMQKFLNYMGINESYLFMNTFVYTITGQYSLFNNDANDPKKIEANHRLLWLAQSPDSRVVKHRHEMFDYMLETNREKLAVVIGVGTAGKDSLATWFQSHDEKCTTRQLSASDNLKTENTDETGFCIGTGNLKGILGIGVRHPGSASARNGGSKVKNSLAKDFERRARVVARHINDGSITINKDYGAVRDFNSEFKYGYASIPHKDFALGTNWRMGTRGTTSNRRGADTIQVFSSNGCYNTTQFSKAHPNRPEKCYDGEVYNKRTDALEKLKKDEKEADPSKKLNEQKRSKLVASIDKLNQLADEVRKYKIRFSYAKTNFPYQKAPIEMIAADDVPYESSKTAKGRRLYDEGPSAEISEALYGLYNQDYKALGVTQDSSFGPTTLYRGDLNSPTVLVLADQSSHTDMFSGRAMTGAQGQYLQSMLNQLKTWKTYLILRNLPVDTLDLSTSKRSQIATDSNVVEARNKLIASLSIKPELIITVGPISKDVASTMQAYPSTKIIHLKNLTYKNMIQEYKKLKSNSSLFYGTAKKELAMIPRQDLPMHTRWWMGTSGDRAARAYIKKEKRFDNNHYSVVAPSWVSKYKAKEMDLTQDEALSLADHLTKLKLQSSESSH